MKKALLMTAIAVFAFTSVNGQELKAGLSFGLPVGDAGNIYNFNTNLDLNYLWKVSEKFDVGVATGLSYNFGDEVRIPNVIGGGSTIIDVEDAVFLPIAGAGRFALSEKFTLGIDLGYAIGIRPSWNDGGFYYAPRVQYSITEAIDLVVAYRSVEIPVGVFAVGYLDNITVGIEIGL